MFHSGVITGVASQMPFIALLRILVDQAAETGTRGCSLSPFLYVSNGCAGCPVTLVQALWEQFAGIRKLSSTVPVCMPPHH